MCGICFCLVGVPFTRHTFAFNPYDAYVNNPYVNAHQEVRQKYFKPDFSFGEHILSNNLFIAQGLTISDIQQSIARRGPDAFNCVQMPFQHSQSSIHQLQQQQQFEFITQNQQQDLSQTEIQQQQVNQNLQNNNNNDLQKQITNNDLLFPTQNENHQSEPKILLAHALLHMRGEANHPVVQPLIQEIKQQQNSQFEQNACALLYNGELYKMRDQLSFNAYSNDTEQLFALLLNFSQQKIDSNEYGRALCANILQHAVGDYAFVYYDEINAKIVFAKDPFGKRSLLLGFDRQGFIVSSCAILAPPQKNNNDKVEKENQLEEAEDEDEGNPTANKSEEFIERKYFQEFFAARSKSWIELPANTLIELDLQTFIWRSFEIDKNAGQFKNLQQLSIPRDLAPAATLPVEIVHRIDEELFKCTKRVIKNIIGLKEHFMAQQNQQPSSEPIQNNDCRLSILFSGGLDCSLLTYYAHKLLAPHESIDLINLAFEKNASDRQTAQKAIAELRHVCAGRKFNLIFVDKTLEDVQKESEHVLRLLYPKTTHMDFNIAMILHLASRGEGYLDTPQTQDNQQQSQDHYKTKARVLLSGLGADELFGGYSRYKNAFRRGGFAEQLEEMSFDLQRLWIRNLGRDDRAISDNSVEVRFPFLDVQLVELLQTAVPAQYLTDFSVEGMRDGTGSKRLLREVARMHSLHDIATYPKKAIQFGTRLANQSNRRAFGSNRRGRGTREYRV